MSLNYDLEKLREAILFNTAEVLPTDKSQLEEELKNIVERANASGQLIRHYIGFEISGQIHIGTGIASALKIKQLQDAGVKCTVWLADYHTWLNNKLDGSIETARKVAKLYFGSVMKKCLEVVGGDPEQLEVLQAEQVYHHERVNGQTFWDFELNAARKLTLSRVTKSISVMGKSEGQDVDFGTLRYPVMQVADAYFMQTHLVHAGMDQRKCHVLMREIASKLPDAFQLKIGGSTIKPIALHHNLLLGLEKKNTQDREVAKMSKSKPDSAIWVHDSKEEITRKLKKAYCPQPNLSQSAAEIREEQVYNPILDWCKNMIYPGGRMVKIERPDKFGGHKNYPTYAELERDYFDAQLHPMDLKNGVATVLSDWFSPIREFVEANPEGIELLKSIKK
jgi:tyrosyl-tRNA synthetase